MFSQQSHYLQYKESSSGNWNWSSWSCSLSSSWFCSRGWWVLLAASGGAVSNRIVWKKNYLKVIYPLFQHRQFFMLALLQRALFHQQKSIFWTNIQYNYKFYNSSSTGIIWSPVPRRRAVMKPQPLKAQTVNTNIEVVNKIVTLANILWANA